MVEIQKYIAYFQASLLIFHYNIDFVVAKNNT
jgi:hypothetical protein